MKVEDQKGEVDSMRCEIEGLQDCIAGYVAKEELQQLVETLDTENVMPLIENIKHTFGLVFTLIDRNYGPSAWEAHLDLVHTFLTKGENDLNDEKEIASMIQHQIDSIKASLPRGRVGQASLSRSSSTKNKTPSNLLQDLRTLLQERHIVKGILPNGVPSTTL
jgi:hypothetical protein